MKNRVSAALIVATLLAAALGSAVPLLAHHEILAKFDDTKTSTITGVVSDVDWKNPHVHVFVNVKKGNDAENWAVELESILDLTRNGWNEETVHPGDQVTVNGILARNASRPGQTTYAAMAGQRPQAGSPVCQRPGILGLSECDGPGRRRCESRDVQARAAQEHRGRLQGGSDAAVGPGAVPGTSAPLPG